MKHYHLEHRLFQAHLQGHRLLLVLSGVANTHQSVNFDELVLSCRKNHQNISPSLKRLPTASDFRLVSLPNDQSKSDVSDQINSLLGSEHQCVLFDARTDFNENLFAAACGTLVAGGLLILRTPDKSEWQHSLFLSRFMRTVESHANGDMEIDTLSPNHLQVISSNNKDQSDHPFPDWLEEQDKLVTTAVDALLDDETSALVIKADRGRGKSAMLGRVLGQLVATGKFGAEDISLSAHRKSACTVLLSHFIESVSDSSQSLSQPIQPQFLPLDESMQKQHEVLVVEEAGSIPIPVLSKLQKQSRKILFATTVQGYEGAGRGFALRFETYLNQNVPAWVLFEPDVPIRWAPNDPLERFVNEALLLKTELPVIDENATLPSTSNAVVSLVDKNTLFDNEELLQDVFGLLVQAHYQTTPTDLRNMLDQDQLSVFTQHCDGMLTGAVLAAKEGCIDTEFHRGIVTKRRRLPDQILPQLLSQSLNNTDVLAMSYLRIVRIAVHPRLHRRGLGSHLISSIKEITKKQFQTQPQIIGTSFGADEKTLAFWLAQGFKPIHHGFKINPRSGLTSSCLAFACNQSTEQYINRACELLNLNLSTINRLVDYDDPVRTQLLHAC